MPSFILASAAETVKLWDFQTWQLTHHYAPYTDDTELVDDITWSNDGHLATVSTSHKLNLKILGTNLVTPPFVPDVEGAICSTFKHNTSTYLAVGCVNGSVSTWDLKKRQIHKVYEAHKCSVMKLAFNYRDSNLVSGSNEGEISVYGTLTGQIVSTLSHPKVNSCTDLRFSTFRHSLLAMCCNEGIVALWDVVSNRCVTTLSAHISPVLSLAFSPVNDTLLVSVGLDKRICCHDSRERKTIRTKYYNEPMTCVDFYRDGSTVVIGTHYGKVCAFDLRNLDQPFHCVEAHSTAIKGLRFQSIQMVIKNKMPRGGSPLLLTTLQKSVLEPVHDASPRVISTELDKLTYDMMDNLNGAIICATPKSPKRRMSIEDIYSPLQRSNPLSATIHEVKVEETSTPKSSSINPNNSIFELYSPVASETNLTESRRFSTPDHNTPAASSMDMQQLILDMCSDDVEVIAHGMGAAGDWTDGSGRSSSGQESVLMNGTPVPKMDSFPSVSSIAQNSEDKTEEKSSMKSTSVSYDEMKNMICDAVKGSMEDVINEATESILKELKMWMVNLHFVVVKQGFDTREQIKAQEKANEELRKEMEELRSQLKEIKQQSTWQFFTNNNI